MSNNQTNDENVGSLEKMIFAQMERLCDPKADLEMEIKRTNALTSAGTVLVNAAKVKIEASRTKLLEEKANEGLKKISNG